jgi:hypothetical protein
VMATSQGKPRIGKRVNKGSPALDDLAVFVDRDPA